MTGQVFVRGVGPVDEPAASNGQCLNCKSALCFSPLLNTLVCPRDDCFTNGGRYYARPGC